MSALPVEVPSSKAAPADAETMTRRLRPHRGGAAERSPRGSAKVADPRRRAGQTGTEPNGDRAKPQRGNGTAPRRQDRAVPMRVLHREGLREGSLGERSLREGRRAGGRSRLDGTWTLPEKEWVHPDGDRLFPGGGRLFTGGRRAAGPAAARPEAAGRPEAARRRTAVGASAQPIRVIRRASVSTSPRSLHLTRRGRVVGAILAAAVAAGLFVAAATAAQATSGSTPRPATGGTERVVVQSGDTLWSIARSADPGADARAVVQEILQLNHISGASITPGQTLLVPKG
jgi:nucleoid-associated protein YgaU